VRASVIPGKTTIVETIFALKLDHQTLLEISGRLAHNLMVRVLEYVRSADLHMTLSRNRAKSRLGSKVDQLPTEIALVLRNTLIQAAGQARV
jgi:hypothetical protein